MRPGERGHAPSPTVGLLESPVSAFFLPYCVRTTPPWSKWRPRTFCSNGALWWPSSVFWLLPRGPPQCCVPGSQTQRVRGHQPSGDSSFPVPTGAGFPGQGKSRNWKVQTLVQTFLLFPSRATSGRIFSPSVKGGPSQPLPHWAMSMTTVGRTLCHPVNGSCHALSSPCHPPAPFAVVVAFVRLWL